jgi:PBP1b-binding outer membrane lipoprotein LpoB
MNKVFLTAILGIVILSGCKQETDAEQKQAEQAAQQQAQQEQQAKIAAYQQKFESMLHICDPNGGVKDYWTDDDEISVVCVNGLETKFSL